MLYQQYTINLKLNKLLEELKTNLVNLYGQKLYSLILFGSQARGDTNPDSDIDIMTVLEDPIDVTKEVYKTSDIRFYGSSGFVGISSANSSQKPYCATVASLSCRK